MGLNAKGLEIVRGWVSELGPREAGVKLINYNLSKLGLSANDLPDSVTFASGLDVVHELINLNDLNRAFDEAKETARQMLEDEGFPGMMENKKMKLGESFEEYSNDALTDMIVNLSRFQGNEEDIQRVKNELSRRKDISKDKKIKENKKMKRVKFKKEFTSIQEALTKVPNQLKEDNNIFEMTDGNKTIEVRWEGTLEEGKAVALLAKDEQLISEDMKHMKRLMGYKSETTIGNHTTKTRVTENDKFKELLAVSKKKILAENLTEEELLDEGVIDGFRRAAVMLGIALASFNAMAQESPQKAVDTVKAKASSVTPEQLDKIKAATGLEFDAEIAAGIFDFTPRPEKVNAPSLYLGKYGDIKAATVTNIDSNDKGGFVYTVELSDKRYVINTDLYRYIGKNNVNLDNTTILFTYKGQVMKDRTIRYK